MAGRVRCTLDGQTEEIPCPVPEREPLAVTFCRGGYSLYTGERGSSRLLADRPACLPEELTEWRVLSSARAALYISGDGAAQISRAEWYLDGGISHADIRPVCFEDGTPLTEQGRVFLTVSSRLETDCYQSVVYWNPTLADFRMEGALFFDYGDGRLNNDVASCIVYDRRTSLWSVWVCAFSQGHILARGQFTADPRFGIQVLDMRLMEPAVPGSDRQLFHGFEGDEDPALIFAGGQWHLAVCRMDQGRYSYYHFVSDNSLDGFIFADHTAADNVTGGMFFHAEGQTLFACGCHHDRLARYNFYTLNNFSSPQALRCDFDDGGFRGWGTVLAIPSGSRTRYFRITFDRQGGSAYTWSYGNIYVYEAGEYTPGK